MALVGGKIQIRTIYHLQIFQRNAEKQRKNKTAIWRSKILSRYGLFTTHVASNNPHR